MILLLWLRVRYDSRLCLSLKNCVFGNQMSITCNLEQSDSLISLIRTMRIKMETIKRRSETSHRNRVPIHLSSYWWAGVSNYVSNTISVITKIYIFLLYFPSVSLLIIRSQPASIAWIAASTAAFYLCWSYTDDYVLWNRCVVYIWY